MNPLQADDAEIAALRAQVEALTKRLEALERSKATAATASTSDTVQVKWGPAPQFSKPDGSASFQLMGQVQADVAYASDGRSDRSDDSSIRRAEFGFSGTLFKDWHYTMVADLRRSGHKLDDAFLAYSGFDFADIVLGQSWEPYSLETTAIASGQTTFLEPSGPNAFAPGRAIGVKAASGGDNYSWAVGYFGGSHGSHIDNSPDDEANSVTGRLTFAPINEEGRVLHLGIAGSHRRPGSSDTVSYGAKPGTSFGSNVVSATITDVSSVNLMGAEFIGILDSFSVVGEYGTVDIDATGADTNFDAYYLVGSYFLTGETRPYTAGNGGFGALQPLENFNLDNGGIGAWEVALRADSIDLNDGAVQGGELDSYGFALNWYLNANLRLMFNYITSDADTATGSDDSDVATMRAQFNF